MLIVLQACVTTKNIVNRSSFLQESRIAKYFCKRHVLELKKNILML